MDSLDANIIRKALVLKEYTNMSQEEFNKYLAEALSKIPPKDKIEICNNLEIILALDFREFLEQEGKRAFLMSNSQPRYYKYLESNISDDGRSWRKEGGYTIPVTVSNEPGRVVLINLFYEETIDFLGHELAHVWYNHPKGLDCRPEARETSYKVLDDLAKAKAGEWGFSSDNFTPRKSI